MNMIMLYIYACMLIMHVIVHEYVYAIYIMPTVFCDVLASKSCATLPSKAMWRQLVMEYLL